MRVHLFDGRRGEACTHEENGFECGRSRRDPVHAVQNRPPDEDGVRVLGSPAWVQTLAGLRREADKFGAMVTEALSGVLPVPETESFASVAPPEFGRRFGAREQRHDGWSLAADALVGGGDVVYGPWPVRQFDLSGVGAWQPYMDLLSALGRLHEPYTAMVFWKDGTRLALVSWGRYNGLSPQMIADEMAADYDEDSGA